MKTKYQQSAALAATTKLGDDLGMGTIEGRVKRVEIQAQAGALRFVTDGSEVSGANGTLIVANATKVLDDLDDFDLIRIYPDAGDVGVSIAAVTYYYEPSVR